MSPLRIDVQGHSTISKPAERATLYILVTATGIDQKTAIQDVTKASNSIQNLLKSDLAPKDASGKPTADAAVTQWTMTGLSTWTFTTFGHVGGQNQTAKIDFEVTFRDFSRLGSVVTNLSSTPHVSIKRIQWSLTEETRRAYSGQNRREAVEDAFAKARDYADAVGLANVTAVDITDSLAPVPFHGPTLFGSTAARGPGFAAAPQELSFEPEDIEMHSQIRVIFEAS